MFCRATGFGGTPKIGTAAAGKILDRTMSVRFDANVAPGLGWKFEAESPEIKLRVGETKTVFYKITNRTDRPTTGIASYNIAPDKGAAFFVKIQCFCFTEHTLQPGESLEAPVVFYIDPEIADKRELDGLKAITLSYTYFPRNRDSRWPRAGATPSRMTRARRTCRDLRCNERCKSRTRRL